MKDTVDAAAKYVIAGVVILGCFVLLYQARGGDPTLPWATITLIVGWLIRDSAGNSATGQVLRIQAAQPTVTATSGPPATTTVTPADPGLTAEG